MGGGGFPVVQRRQQPDPGPRSARRCDLTKVMIHDTGTTNNAYDAAGNLLTKSDARCAAATYTYDVLN
jgi:hypothetical protein